MYNFKQYIYVIGIFKAVSALLVFPVRLVVMGQTERVVSVVPLGSPAHVVLQVRMVARVCRVQPDLPGRVACLGRMENREISDFRVNVEKMENEDQKDLAA